MNNTIELTTLLHMFQANKDKWLKNSTLKGLIDFDIRLQWGMSYYEGITPIRIRQLIKELRQMGHIIIGGNLGYKLTTNLDEIQHYLKSRWGEITREMKSLKAIAQSCNMIDQLKIWENEYE